MTLKRPDRQRGPKMDPKWPSSGPTGKGAQKYCKMAFKTARLAKRVQNEPKMARPAKWTQNGFEMALKRPHRQSGSKMNPKWPSNGPTGKVGPK